MGQADGTVFLVDATTGRTLDSPLVGHTSQVVGTAFTHDGKHVATTSFDGSTRLWDVDPHSWVTHACKIAGRNLTRAEWKQYLGERPYERTCE
jgi:FOG: WD40 repeat